MYIAYRKLWIAREPQSKFPLLRVRAPPPSRAIFAFAPEGASPQLESEFLDCHRLMVH